MTLQSVEETYIFQNFSLKYIKELLVDGVSLPV
jgi:hypothetical protein